MTIRVIARNEVMKQSPVKTLYLNLPLLSVGEDRGEGVFSIVSSLQGMK
jgi:hypothetical protein